ARLAIDKALQAHGGRERIEALESVSLEYTGLRTMINQSRRALGPWDREPSSGRVVFDRKGTRLYAENHNHYPGIGRFSAAWALKGNEGYHWDLHGNSHGREWMMKYSGADAEEPWAFVPRWMPPFLLLAAAQAHTQLRHAGVVRRNGRAHDAVVFTQRNRQTLTLLIDRATARLAAFESVRGDGVHGDVLDTVAFDGYRRHAGVMFPGVRTDFLNGALARRLDLAYQVNAPLPDTLFELPRDVRAPATPAHGPPHGAHHGAPAGGRLKRIGEGVYLDTDMGGVMIVEFRDFLVVVECPGDHAMSQSTIDAARARFPDKPIRYVVPSHTHGDHGGGARAYFHLGATLLTTPANVPFYRRLAKVRHTISPDPWSASKRAPRIETFESYRRITDGTQTLDLHDLGPNAHSDTLVFAWLPAQRILWQADLVFSPAIGPEVNAAMPITVAFARRLVSLGITDLASIVESHHDRVISVEEFRASLRMAGHDYP
ncbi:MAG: MBL fold metallo-hydrolase, partial [Betaproteobacteria bacterium]|nr:MBL fold metallo-hydrolase [Betaproteobacteria bacterium]